MAEVKLVVIKVARKHVAHARAAHPDICVAELGDGDDVILAFHQNPQQSAFIPSRLAREAIRGMEAERWIPASDVLHAEQKADAAQAAQEEADLQKAAEEEARQQAETEE